MKRWLWFLFALVILCGLAIGSYFYWRSRQIAATPPAPFHVLIVGDSIAQGVGSVKYDNSLEQYLSDSIGSLRPDLTIENKAVSGAKTEEVLNNQLTKTFREHYGAAIVIVGTNDITHLVSPSTFEANYATIIQALSAKADRVVLANIPQFSNTPIVPKTIQSLADSRTKSYNNKIDNIANGYQNVRIFNFFAFSQNRLHGEVNYLATDGFHPNDDGYQLIAQELSSKILQP